MFLLNQIMILALLALVGDPLRRVFSSKMSVLRNLDIFQIVVLDMYLGGFVFYIVASLPFRIYTAGTTLLLIGISTVFLIFSVKTNSTQWKKRLSWQSVRNLGIMKTEIALGLSLIAIFFTLMWIESEAASGILFGNVHDASMFSMLSSVISRNEMIPLTLSPFESSGIIYPQGYTIMLNFSSYVLNSGPENLILVLNPLFIALTSLGAYFLGKIWSGKMSYGVIFAFFFAFVSRWPSLLVWGSYAFVAGFPFYLIVLGIVFKQKPADVGSRTHFVEWLFTGLVIGFLGAIHATYYEVTIVTLFLVGLGYVAYARRKAIQNLGKLFVVFFSSLIPVSVFLLRYIESSSLQSQNFGLPQDLPTPHLNTMQTNLNVIGASFFDSDWISPYPLLKVFIMILIGLSVTLVMIGYTRRWYRNLRGAIIVSVGMIAATGLIVILASGELGLSFLLTLINVNETAILLFISLIILSAIVVSEFLDKIHSTLLRRNHKQLSVGLVVVLFIGIFSPFVYYSLSSNVGYINGVYSYLSTATQDDYTLMKEIRGKLPQNSVILINPYDAGGFIPSIAGYKVVFPFTASRNSESYARLCSLVLQNNLNDTAYSLMRQLNVTHVFVGSKASEVAGASDWNWLLFIGNPNFRLVNKVGASCLFAFTPSDTNVAFFDGFESPYPLYNGWTNVSSTDSNGDFNFSLISGTQYRNEGQNSLALTVQAESDHYSLNWIERIICLPHQKGHVILSFYIDSTQDFGQNSGLTFIISNLNWTKQFLFSTYERGDSVLENTKGLHIIDLTSYWNDKFDESVPSQFHLQIETSAKNASGTFYVDSLAIERIDG